MKIVSLNLAGRTNFGRDYNRRIADIADFLSKEDADIVCLSEVTFDGGDSLAEVINEKLKKPYQHVRSEMSERYTFDKFSAAAMENWEKGLFESSDEYLTDGMAVLSKLPITNYRSIILTPAPKDDRGRPDNRVRLVQNVDFSDGTKISNAHLATNNNNYLQLAELVKEIGAEKRMIIGDLNMPHSRHTLPNGQEILGMQDCKNIWGEKYTDSTEFTDYISFPSEKSALDHLLLPDDWQFVSVRTVEGLSDHNALILEIERSDAECTL